MTCSYRVCKKKKNPKKLDRIIQQWMIPERLSIILLTLTDIKRKDGNEEGRIDT